MKETREALMEISWYLNFRQDETISVDEIAEDTGIEWGVVHNCINTLEKTQRITPDIEYNDDVTVEESESAGLEPDILEDEAYTSVLYIFITKKYDENITSPICTCEHEVLKREENGIEEAVKVGWLERNGENKVSLTPKGVGIAGPSHSRIENLD